MLLGIILHPLLARFSLICRMWAFPIIHVIGLWGKRTGLSFWAGARGLGVSLGLLLLWAWRVGLRAYFSNPISLNFFLIFFFRFPIAELKARSLNSVVKTSLKPTFEIFKPDA